MGERIRFGCAPKELENFPISDDFEEFPAELISSLEMRQLFNKSASNSVKVCLTDLCNLPSQMTSSLSETTFEKNEVTSTQNKATTIVQETSFEQPGDEITNEEPSDETTEGESQENKTSHEKEQEPNNHPGMKQSILVLLICLFYKYTEF